MKIQMSEEFIYSKLSVVLNWIFKWINYFSTRLLTSLNQSGVYLVRRSSRDKNKYVKIYINNIKKKVEFDLLFSLFLGFGCFFHSEQRPDYSEVLHKWDNRRWCTKIFRLHFWRYLFDFYIFFSQRKNCTIWSRSSNFWVLKSCVSITTRTRCLAMQVRQSFILKSH